MAPLLSVVTFIIIGLIGFNQPSMVADATSEHNIKNNNTHFNGYQRYRNQHDTHQLESRAYRNIKRDHTDAASHCIRAPATLQATCNAFSWASETRLPNLLNHQTPLELDYELISPNTQNILDALANDRVECRLVDHLKLLLCTNLSPACLDILVPPCKKLCMQAKGSCKPALQRLGLEWPKFLDCTRFPASGESICIERQPITIVSTPLVAENSSSIEQAPTDANVTEPNSNQSSTTPVSTTTLSSRRASSKRRRKDKKNRDSTSRRPGVTQNSIKTITPVTSVPLELEHRPELTTANVNFSSSLESNETTTTNDATIISGQPMASSPPNSPTTPSTTLAMSAATTTAATPPPPSAATTMSTTTTTTTTPPPTTSQTVYMKNPNIAMPIPAVARARNNQATSMNADSIGSNFAPTLPAPNNNEKMSFTSVAPMPKILNQDLAHTLCETNPDWLIKAKLTDNQLMVAAKRRKLKVRSFRQIFGSFAANNRSTTANSQQQTHDSDRGGNSTRPGGKSPMTSSIYLNLSNSTMLIFPAGPSLLIQSMSEADTNLTSQPSVTPSVVSSSLLLGAESSALKATTNNKPASSSKTFLIVGVDKSPDAQPMGPTMASSKTITHIILWPGTKTSREPEPRASSSIVKIYRDFKLRGLGVCQSLMTAIGETAGSGEIHSNMPLPDGVAFTTATTVANTLADGGGNQDAATSNSSFMRPLRTRKQQQQHQRRRAQDKP